MTASLSDQGFTYANGNTVGFANTIPTTGTYAAGDVILENKPGSALSGWKRQTTGANHVLGTDWVYFNYVTQGSAPVFGARAWCVFNGTLTGTNAPMAGGNVASVTRMGVGGYTVNFSTALPGSTPVLFGTGSVSTVINYTSATTMSVTFTVNSSSSGAAIDLSQVGIAVIH